ncbi:Type 1 glutamine amidotransferase-like domain-containing protein [Paraburkholderia guartelaensis]|uniref:Type 1 glutamine amidotransferase-like domain-containing protein n=1 Tax=Paraburkholderia guartelaensis TaxID=2546446 RepID=UPI002AB787A2|nr:peptidase E [Paraburkholderia guartelaensis]
MRQILAIGGGGFMMESTPSPVDRLIRDLTAKTQPAVCFLATPSGDLPAHIDRFHETYGALGCNTSHLAFFRQPDSRSIKPSSYREALLQQDAIFVGGGNTKSALAVWREWALDGVLREAWQQGILLAGMSAGAMCWFDAGLTDSFWGGAYRPLPCLGFLPGGCAVHYGSDPKRRETLHAAQRARAVPPSVAIDDFAAVLYADTHIDRVFAWRDGASAWRVSVDGDEVVETALAPERL